ncbi:MAG: hypothetical protein ACXAC5_01660 [Promethearchaeota archaeon]|jgi:hypothetical protein
MLEVEKLSTFEQDHFMPFAAALHVRNFAEVGVSYRKGDYKALLQSMGLAARKFTIAPWTPWDDYDGRTHGYNYRNHHDVAMEQSTKGKTIVHLDLQWNAVIGKSEFQDVILTQFAVVQRGNSRHYYSSSREQNYRCFVEVKHHGLIFVLTCNFNLAEALFDITLTPELQFKIADQTYEFPGVDRLLVRAKRGYYESDDQGKPFDFTAHSLDAVLSSFSIERESNLNNFLRGARARGYDAPPVDLAKKGVSKIFNVVDPLLEEIKETQPLLYLVFRTFVANCHRTIDGVRLSTVFNAELGKATTADEAVAALKPLLIKGDDEDRYGRSRRIFGYRWFESRVTQFPCYKDKRRAALKSNSTRAFNKLMQEYDFLGMDEKKFPRISKAVKEGEIPISTFFRKKEQYFLLNDNWALWEQMLKRHRAEAIALAQEVCRRTTYEKDLMSYFYFILYALPEYLKKHTKRKWTCFPKLVESASELDPPKEEEGVARKRSALTPIVDNRNSVVVVPYASLAMPGRQTTYCYSHTYNVIHKGLGFNGNVAIQDLEEKLNGRDDYGLMFYTLTGSAQGRGYPTFLIIFERLASGTRVHFHRAHPSRSKDGDYNPIHNWIKVCYNWMAGNTPRNLIRYQQGDLIFVEDQKEREYTGEPVDAYDQHVFEATVDFAPYSAKGKENILGYVRLNRDTVLNHSEHESVPMVAGRYVIRQCRSWEANPKGVWSLRID